MNTIHKFPVAMDNFVLKLPTDAQVLCVQVQRDNPQLWVKLNSEQDAVDRRFIVVGTGHVVPDGYDTYIGSFQLYGGSFVGHLFESKK